MKKLFALLDNDKVLLVVSLFVAVALWMVVISDRNPTDTDVVRGIEISYINRENIDASGLNIISPISEDTDVKISGRLTELQAFSRQNITATVDLSGIYAPGYYERPVVVTQTKSGISVDSVTPQSITVRIDYINTNKRDVEVVFVGQSPEGYEITKAVPAVSSVTVEGPEKTLEKIAKAVATVDITEIKESGSVNSAIRLLDSDGMEIADTELTVSSNATSVDIEVLKIKTVPVQVILSGEVDVEGSGISVVPTPYELVIKGTEEALETIEKIDTEPILHIPESNAVISTALVIPEGVLCETETVSVAFTIEQSVENNTNVNEN